MAADQSLFLDSAIRDWVLLPITLVMILVGVLRHNVMQLLESPPKKGTLKALREQRILTRSNVLRQNYGHIAPSAFAERRDFLIEALSSGSYLQTAGDDGKDAPAGPQNPLASQGGMDAMIEPLKKQMVMMVPQTVIMGWINFFFSGFVLIKLPFPLTLRFKLMMQRGIDTADMDVTWVSSLSWYFLNLFGLNAIYMLLLGDGNAADGSRDMAAMGGMGGAGGLMGGGPGAPDFTKLYSAERDNLELVGVVGGPTSSSIKGKGRGDVPPRWVAEGIEDRVLALYS